MSPESGCIHNLRHNEKYDMEPGVDVCDKQWRRGTEPGKSGQTEDRSYSMEGINNDVDRARLYVC